METGERANKSLLLTDALAHQVTTDGVYRVRILFTNVASLCQICELLEVYTESRTPMSKHGPSMNGTTHTFGFDVSCPLVCTLVIIILMSFTMFEIMYENTAFVTAKVKCHNSFAWLTTYKLNSSRLHEERKKI